MTIRPPAGGLTQAVADATYQAASSDLTDLVARWVAASAAGPASLDFLEDADNGTNKVTLAAPSALAADRAITFPDRAGELAIIDTGAYGAGWDGSDKAPSQNAVYDKIESLSSGAPLAKASYNGTLINPSTTSGTSADVDATNLVLPAFTAPASGAVWFEANILVDPGGADVYVDFAVREGSSDVSGTPARVIGGASVQSRVHYKALITGLTPGSSHTYKLGWRRASGSAAATAFAGGTVGQATLEVRAAA